MRIVDLRSDTLTLPTDEMRQAMYKAEVGDDVYGEDPTINRLEQLGASLAGKEAGLFVTSGTMGNQVAVMAHTKKGDEVICEAESHIFYYEAAGISCLAGAQPRQVIGDKGILSAKQIEEAVRPADVHMPVTRLICLENTHNRAGGTCYTLDGLAEIQKVAAARGIRVHMDGARVFNAAVAQKVCVSEIAAHVDTLQFCLSKGLCAPVGSLLVGSRQFIDIARKYRKMLGGGMRQAGILAAAGIVALEKMVDRLAEDHYTAKYLAESLAEIGFGIDLSAVQTNIVIFDVAPFGIKAADFVEKLRINGIKANLFGGNKIRMVTHYGISADDIRYTVGTVAKLLTR